MPARRLALATFVVLLIPISASATSNPSATQRPDSLSRRDIITGKASQAQQRRALRASIELAGGEAVDVAGAQSSGLGGYGQALIAAELDGDAGEEILLEQFVKSRRYVLAADDDGVIWRQKMERGPWFAGYLVDDFAPGGGNEVLMIAHEWLGADGERVIFGLVGAHGLLWTYEAPGSSSPGGPFSQGPFHEINGSVQADGDEQAEIAITTWSDSGSPQVLALDGEDGTELTTLKPTLETETELYESYSQAFVTDGEPGQSDEAVFITSLPTGGGYFAERLRFNDGTRTDYQVIAPESFGEIYQGLDYSGDGRRDAFTDGYTDFGVFDPISFTSWTHEHDYGSLGYPEIPDPVGDLDGDGGEDLCALLEDFVGGPSPYEYEITEHIDCRSGKTGARLWTAASPTVRSTETGYGWAFITTRYDLNGDGHPDPIIGAEESSCEEAGGCETSLFEASAVNGKTGGALWSLNDPALESRMWNLTEGNLDDLAGDDLFEVDEESDRAEFRVLNGLSMEPSWHGVVRPDSDYGAVLDWGHADVDGDGTTEAVVTAYATDLTCDWHGCSGDTGLYVAAFGGNGDLLWQTEL